MLIMGYLGAVIGAGFASGQEIVQFFVAYGNHGLQGVFVSILLFAASGGVLLYTTHKLKTSDYQKVLAYLCGEKLGGIVDFLLAIFLFLGLSTMLAASGAVFYEHLYLPKTFGIFLAYVMLIITLAAGRKGLFYSFNVLVPIKLILLILISGYVVIFGDIATQSNITFLMPQDEKYWLLSSILYVAYNFSLAMVVLSEYQSVSSPREGIWGAVEGGLLLGGLVLLNYLALQKFLPMIMHYEVPMLFVAGQISLTAKHIYTLVLWVGILTTAIANAFAFAQRFAKFTGLSYPLCLIFCLTMALPLSLQSFSGLVSKVYPVFGMLGILILGALSYRFIVDLMQGSRNRGSA
ncbi:Uncharacterized [Syntrophomonas zehnderi OL-4]|uniref:Uncharacterized n=2 Tax=Syntrophomonas TaxID=862 RepID=A0A0E4C7H7_9FIRM|nr:Uncharacterized [Syntrophomonas zehnderi OL-4]